MKFCSKCNTEKKKIDFYKCKKMKDGLTSYCKECMKKSARDWARNNPEKNRLKSKKRNKEHPGEAVFYGRRWRENNLEKARKISRDWKKNNPEMHRQWNIDHPDKVRASRKKYFHNRRLIIKETDIDIKYLIQLREQSELCLLCGKKIHDMNCSYHPDQRQLDHIVPISIGGKHIKDNVRYVCGSCNNHRPRKGQDL